MNCPNTTSSSLKQGASDELGNTTSAPPEQPHPLQVGFGKHLEVIATTVGVDPADVALAITSVLSGIAGPYAGFVTPYGHRIHCGLNVVRTDASNPAATALENLLLHPLRTRARFLRARAAGMSNTLADQWAFGRHGENAAKQPPLPWIMERGHKHASTQAALFKSDYLPAEYFDEAELMSPLYYGGSEPLNVEASVGPTHLPSVMFERLALHEVLPALNESLHREALVCNPSAGMFSDNGAVSSKEGGEATKLADLLRGKDMSFPKVHPDQGHGTFEHARVHLWATSSTERLGAILKSASAWNNVLKGCLLWDPSPSSGGSSSLEGPKAIGHYNLVVHQVLETRCFGRNNQQVRIGLSIKSAAKYASWRTGFEKILARVSEQDREHTVQFHDLPERLMWMFMQFRQEGEPTWSPMAAAFHTAVYAIKKHQRLLQSARTKQAEIEAQFSLQTVESVLKRKGPCKLRDLQRSTNNVPAARLRPGLDLLKQQGRVAVDEQNRYVLIPAEN
ncbi:MAG: hypothetical protein ACO1TE_27210 [Prosthecobacter sp.]